MEFKGYIIEVYLGSYYLEIDLRKLALKYFSTTAQDAIIYWFDTDPICIGAAILHMSF
jgi:hypothetical protein